MSTGFSGNRSGLAAEVYKRAGVSSGSSGQHFCEPSPFRIFRGHESVRLAVRRRLATACVLCIIQPLLKLRCELLEIRVQIGFLVVVIREQLQPREVIRLMVETGQDS